MVINTISRQFAFALPDAIENSLGESLNSYIEAVIAGQDTNEIVGKCNFTYRLLRSSSYHLSDSAAYLGGRYYEETDIFALTLGDTIICAKFEDNDDLPEDFRYLGLEDIIKSSALNRGIATEQYSKVDTKTWENAMLRMAAATAFSRLYHEKEFADMIWHEMGLEGSMPDEIFIDFIQQLYSEDVKPGDCRTPERYMQILDETLKSFGYTPPQKLVICKHHILRSLSNVSLLSALWLPQVLLSML